MLLCVAASRRHSGKVLLIWFKIIHTVVFINALMVLLNFGIRSCGFSFTKRQSRHSGLAVKIFEELRGVAWRALLKLFGMMEKIYELRGVMIVLNLF